MVPLKNAKRVEGGSVGGWEGAGGGTFPLVSVGSWAWGDNIKKARSVRARQHHYANHSVVLQRANHRVNHVANDFSHNLAKRNGSE